MIVAVLFMLLPLWTMAQDQSAYDIYTQLLEESIDSSKRYSEGKAAWTLGRSGESHIILNLLSPGSDTLDEFVQSLPPERRELFLKEIFRQEISEEGVQDLEEAWQTFLAKERQGADTPLASLSEETAQKIFDGTFPGLEGESLQSTYDKQWNLRAEMKLKFEQYAIELTSLTVNNGRKKMWFLYFQTQEESYGDFEEMLRIVRSVLGSTDSSSGAVMQFTTISLDDDVIERNKKLWSLANTLMNQIYRPSDRWMRFYNMALAARMLSGDTSGLREMTSWNWDQSPSIPKPQEFVDDYGVSLETAQKALENIAWAEEVWGSRVLDPFVFWQNAPIGEHKREFFKSVIARLIEDIANAEDERHISEMMWLLQDIWKGLMSLEHEMESLLRPRPKGPVGRILSHRPPPSAVKEVVDVNTIALGIEYTGRFPIETRFHVRSIREDIVYHEWNRERESIMEDVARELSLGLRGTGEIQQITGGHGHGLGHSYAFFDSTGRRWQMDWDGIQRNYDDEGKVIQETVGGGHLEVATAKFVPKVWEIEAVYKVFKKFHIIPTHIWGGGGHINVDLAPFEGRPRAMARFIALFHEYEDIIKLMFSHREVVVDYISPPIRRELLRELQSFQGTEEELKEMLYNNRYFNSLAGRKTRYTPLNIIPYFQDVIPKKFLGEDFDVLNANVSWEPRFRFVKPEHKRIELRFFDAPRDPLESALHIRFVRAMLHGAFNEDFPLGVRNPETDTLSWLEAPQKAWEVLDSLCQTLKLECRHYRTLLAEGLSEADIVNQSLGPEGSLKRVERTVVKKEWASSQTLQNDELWGRAVLPCKEQVEDMVL